jgi:superfamily II DNA or RNA helicase
VDERLRLRFEPGSGAPSSGGFLAWLTDPDAGGGAGAGPAALAEALDGAGLPRGAPTTVAMAVAGDGRDGVADVARLPLLPTVRWLAALPLAEDLPARDRPSTDVLAWSLAAKLALELVAAGHLVPALVVDEVGELARAAWRAVTPGDVRPERIARALATEDRVPLDRDGRRVDSEALVRAFLDAVADVSARGGRSAERDPRGAPRPQPFAAGWLEALVGADPRVAGRRDTALVLADDIAEWSSPLEDPDRDVEVGLVVRVAALEGDAGAGASDDERWRIVLGLRDREQGAVVEAVDVWSGDAIDLGHGALTDPAAVLLRRLAVASRLYPPLERALDTPKPDAIVIGVDEVVQLIDEGRAALEAAGVTVVLPPELRDTVDRPLRLRLRVGSGAEAPRLEGDDGLSLRSLAGARYEVVLGDDVLDADELVRLGAAASRLVRWRGRWVRIAPGEVERLAGEVGRSPQLGLTEALAAALARQHHDDELGWLEVVVDGSAAELVERVRVQPGPGEARIDGLRGELRAYQARGVAWLQRMAELGLGAVLADQMGLGKTIQAIALLASRAGDRPNLVVAPTSVVGNWEREIERFAPGLEVVRHHGGERASGIDAFVPGAVVITTYALLRRDASLLTAVPWDVVVLDEAQQVKNPASLGARVARGLEARMRLAMTGTPVENRLLELWAVVDLTNPGLLGARRAFERRFAAPIERWHDAEAADRLHRLVAPFVLRRRKDDDDVALDLPERIVVGDRVPLTAEQAALYDAAVESAFSGAGLGSSAFERRGRILALITALKQICNHPAHFLRDGGPLPGRSGKLDRLTELLAEVLAGDERVLLFTQYREMGDLLVGHLRGELGLVEAPFLHGGLTIAQRDAMVRRFQEDEDADPVLIVSLRAGGTGLNLTRASQVIHFDRWWNPAVEDQATDRAHRIGQHRTVTVHTLVSSGTVEERIDAMLERKRGLADAVAGRSEAWLTELDDDDLRELVVLSADPADEDVTDAIDVTDGAIDARSDRPLLRVVPGGAP